MMSLLADSSDTAAFEARPGALVLRGVLDTAAAARLWTHVMRAADLARGTPLIIDVAGIADVNTAGAALVSAAMVRHGAVTLVGASDTLRKTVDQLAAPIAPAPPPPALSFRRIGRQVLTRTFDVIAFFGESLVAAATLSRRRRQVRWTDLVRLIDEAGVRAVPLVLLLGFLMGLILAFQASIPLRRFGADLFVVNMVSLSLLRELGPLLAAVILAGRTGSAFAAELGTMAVNLELAALRTIGVSTMTMLVLPRLAAAVLVMPALTLLLEMAGLCGMLTVMLSFGFPVPAVSAQLLRAVHGRDLWGGLFKAVCFGAVAAGIGCGAGLATGDGPRAVGRSATAAVVGGIVATVILDGVFAVLFYRIGI